MSKTIDNYWNRYNQSKHYTELLFRDGYGTQASEHNELQSIFADRVRGIADALFRDGDIIRDGQIVVNAETGEVKASQATVYLAGAVWAVPPTTFTIPKTGSIAIGIRLATHIVSELEDAGLRNPATGSRGEGEPGAWRRKVTALWGYDGDGGTGDFFPVYMVDDCVQRAKETPPNLDSMNQALARYDRDSTGTGTYAVSGLTVIAGEDLSDGRQVYHVSEGRARVDGMGIELPTSRRIVYDPEPDLRHIDTEVHSATAQSASEGQRITIAHPPMKAVTGLRITLRKTVSVTHGAYSGAVDDLPDTSVVTIESCVQGDTTYEAGTDFKKTGDTVDWSPSGNEPSPGSSYRVTYTYIDTVEPTSPDADGFTVSDAVEGTSILVSYDQMLPRYDRLAVTAEGLFTWFQGVASERNPQPPAVPETMLALATVYQAWRPNRSLANDSVRVVPFDEIANLNRRIDYALQEIARQRLEADVATRESGTRVGMFVDPLIDDSMRDQGIEQTAAIVDGVLTLPITDASILLLPQDVEEPSARDYTVVPILSQLLRTGSMKVNPYQAFDPLPAKVVLTPSVDHWTDTQTKWTSALTRTLTRGSGLATRTSSSTATEVVSSSTQQLEHLRQIPVRFRIEGFGAGETLSTIHFDGVTVTPTA